MSKVDIIVPDLPESVIDATVVAWHKKIGDIVNREEILVEIETSKVVLEIPASVDGILDTILKDKGSIVTSHQVLGRLYVNNNSFKKSLLEKKDQSLCKDQDNDALKLAIRRLLSEHNLEVRTTKNNAIISSAIDCAAANVEKELSDALTDKKMKSAVTVPYLSNRSEKRIPMTRLRKRISERLLEAKNSTAMLTTFNEVNMKAIMDLLKKYGEKFEKRHNIRLSFMSFYVKAVAEALRRYPEINASIDGDDIIYYSYFDLNIAVSTPRGLVTPVLRNVDNLNIVDIEKKLKELSVKGYNGKLTVEDLTGGNFTITNGGAFGSLMSTPIINPPQSAILGMHAVKDRPMAVDKKVEILPMMYLALSYDHRLIDGQESIGFLLTIKELIEDPIHLLLEI